jgi:dolichol-phosphate mannosyltransferase
LYYLAQKLFLPVDWPQGFASTTLLILLSMGVNSLLLGIIGEYIGRIYKNVKQGPIVIVEDVIDALPVPVRAQPPIDAEQTDRRADLVRN